MNLPIRPAEFSDSDPVLAEVLDFVRGREGGVDATEIRRHFEDRYNADSVRRALRIALDRGRLRLGSELQLVA